MIAAYFVLLLILSIFSYGFIDLNLHLSTASLFLIFQKPLETLVFHMRPQASGLFLVLLLMLFIGYLFFLKNGDRYFSTGKKLILFIVGVAGVLWCAFPAFTYDIFNYITTAKVTFFYHENPYLVMPVEIPNEPYLAFTRAANKVALYGPVWIILTAIPHALGQGNIWQTIIAFKLLNAALYLGFSFLIYRVTRSVKNVLFFAINPLVLIEVLISAHNDLVMMLFALIGLLLWTKKGIGSKIISISAFLASFLVKGATLVLLPLLFIRKLSCERMLIMAYWLLACIFFVFAPLREELYPWYAVWLITVASFMDLKKHAVIIGFTIVLSFALELRQLPYIYMGEYGGVGPLVRMVLTLLPLCIYGGYVGIQKVWRKK